VTMAAPTPQTRPDGNLNLRRSWTLVIGSREHVVTVQYAMLSGFMSIETDGQRVARAWREFQTVMGGANLNAQLDGHTLSARITQRFGTQAYLFSLRIDGEVVHGSDPQPAPRQVTRQTWSGIVALAITIAVITQIGRFPLIAAWSVVVGLASIAVINANRITGGRRLLVVVALVAAWVIGMYEIALAFYRSG
jgi:hypothetical protein